MRGRRGQSWRDLATEMGLIVCDSKIGCQKGWGTKAHRDGRVDYWGITHWDGFRRHRVTTRGLRQFLKLVALAFNQKWIDEPEWMRIWHVNTWAYAEAQRRYHIRLHSSEANKDRERLLLIANRRRIRLRTHYPTIYGWCMNWKYR